MELYIVRHGQTVWNAEGRLQGSEDIELNENGRELAGKLGESLEGVKFDRIYSSPLIRAYETACLIRGHRNIPIIRDERIREISFGVMEGHDYREFFSEGSPYFTFFSAPEKYGPPREAESFEDVIKRTGEFFRQVIMKECTGLERVMVVAHGTSNKAFMYNLEGQTDISKYWGPGLQKNGEADIYILGKEGWKRKPGTSAAIDERWGKRPPKKA
ncbi:MAG: histidine phosphatase family protein [Lachnospiraceae bacterium]|nr:histidine phosphatase family protein [Lachnospiraceae bacterium]